METRRIYGPAFKIYVYTTDSHQLSTASHKIPSYKRELEWDAEHARYVLVMNRLVKFTTFT